MRPGIDPKVDFAFKRLFGSEEAKAVLIHLLNAVIRPPSGREVVEVTLLNPFNEKDKEESKLSILDIKVRDASGRLFNVEMQMIAPTAYVRRIVYYWAKLYQDQLKEGDDFDLLRPTISISFLNNRRIPDTEYHHVFGLRDEGGQVTLTDDLAIHVIELPKFTLAAEELTSPLEVWCYFLRNGETLDTASLPAALDIAPVRRALEVLDVMSHNDTERELYEARLKARRDRNAELKDAKEEGEKLGEDKGREQGELIGQIRTCQRLLKHPVASRDELAALNLEELTGLAAELERQAFPPT